MSRPPDSPTRETCVTGALRRWLAACVALLALSATVGARAQEPAPDNAGARPATRNEPLVLSIEVAGNRRYSAAEIAGGLGQQIGAPVDAERVRRGIETLWISYRVRAEVSYRPVPGGVELRIDVEELEFDPAPRFIGNSRVDVRELMEWAGLEQESEVYLYQAARIRRQLLNGYRRKGFFFAEVQHVVRPRTDTEAADVIFEIREGPRVKVDEIVIAGNESVPDRGWWLTARGLRTEADIQLRSPWIFGWFPKYFTEEVLAEDVIALRQVYRNRGYWDAIVQVERLEFSDDREWVTIHIAVDEGERYRVTDVRIEAYEQIDPPTPRSRPVERPTELILPEEELLALCGHKPGEWYTQYQVDRDSDALRRRYGEIGHLHHSSLPEGDRWVFLGVEPTFDVERKEVALVYRIAQGRQQFLHEIRIAGNLHTRDRVIRRLVSVFPGEVADLTRIERSLARIRGTGYFSNEFNPAEHQDPRYRFVATDAPNWKDLEFLLEEGNVWNFQFGVQIGSDSGLQGFLEMRVRNFDASRPPSPASPFTDLREREAFHGAGQSLQINLTPGTEFSSYHLRFTEPDLFMRHIDRIGLTVGVRRSLRRFRSHDERRTGFDLELFRQLDFDTRVFLGFEATEIRVSDLDTAGEGSLLDPISVPNLLFEQLGDSRLHGLQLGISRSKVDNVMNPRDGYTATGTLTVYDSLVGSDHEFVRLDANWRHYSHFGRRDRGPGLRLFARGGVQVPYGDSDDVPYTERFFLGGSQILRGFELRGVGPHENGYSVGGETYLAGSAEYVYPLLTQGRAGSPELYDVLRGGLFVDAGLIDPDPFRLDPEELRVSTGVSLSLVAGLPITISLGFPLVEREGDRTKVLHFQIGSL